MTLPIRRQGKTIPWRVKVTPREAIRILMLSPCYQTLSVPERKKLVAEYCASFNALAAEIKTKRKAGNRKQEP